MLLDNVDDAFQRSLLDGLNRAGRQEGCDVVAFLGGNLNPDDPESRRRNGIFELVGEGCLDGLIVPSLVVASHIGEERLASYCRRFEPLPMVSLGTVLPSMPSVVCEGEPGMRALMEHLLDRHRRRRLAFVAGTERNPDSVLRERVFREVLAERGIPVDPRLLLRGHFMAETTREAVRGIVDAGIPFDALVCATDVMALAAAEALEQAGIPLPGPVSVTGFDDLRPSGQEFPLTTVHQPIAELAERAVQIVLRLVRGESVDAIERLPTRLVVRRSCGCLSAAATRAGQRADDGQNAHGAARDASADERRCLEELTEALRAAAQDGGDEDGFTARLDAWLGTPFGHALGDGWDDLLSALRREAKAGLAPAGRVEDLLHRARVMVKEAAEQRVWREHARLVRNTQSLQYVIENLTGSFDVPTLLDGMARELPRIGIRRCFLAVHASSARPYDDARLLLAYDERGRRELGEGILYPARQLLPAGLAGDRPQLLLLQPLIFEEEEVGFVALDFDPFEDISSLALAGQIRSALKSSMMMQEIREKDRRLLEIDRRRNEFVANVTHDFRSLVTIVSSSTWAGLHPDTRQSPEETRELFEMAYEASLRLKVAIDRLLDLASMDDRGLVLRIRRFRPRRFLGELAAFYRPVLAASGIALETDLPDAEVEDLVTDPDKVEQIMHNLLSNAAKFVQPGRGRVRLSLAVRDGAVDIAVRDDGEGIPPERLAAIFVRYGSRQRGARRSGTGIGLAFVKELATYLDGSVAASSDGPGTGATFTVTLPRGKPLPEGAGSMEVEEADAKEAEAVRQQYRQLLESSLRGRKGSARPVRA